MPAPLKFTAAQQSKLQAIGIQPAKVTRAYIKREGFDTKADFLEHANFEYRISAKYGAVAAQRKIERKAAQRWPFPQRTLESNGP